MGTLITIAVAVATVLVLRRFTAPQRDRLWWYGAAVFCGTLAGFAAARLVVEHERDLEYAVTALIGSLAAGAILFHLHRRREAEAGAPGGKVE